MLDDTNTYLLCLRTGTWSGYSSCKANLAVVAVPSGAALFAITVAGLDLAVVARVDVVGQYSLLGQRLCDFP